MNFIVLIIIIIIIWHLYNKNKAANGVQVEMIGKRNTENIIWVCEYDRRKNVGKFENGVIQALSQSPGFSPWVVGYYDENGNTYNVEKSLIGKVDSRGRILLSKEYQFEETKRILPKRMLPDIKLTKSNAELCRIIGESLGSEHGTIFEGFDYEKGMAYYETNGKTDIVEPMVGAGAAYIALVYEGLIPSRNKEFYTPNPAQWIEKK